MKYLLLGLLATLMSVAAAETIINLETPNEGATYQGVDTIRGWAVSDDGIEEVQLFIDGKYAGQLPIGSLREDVGAAFPNMSGSDLSGFAGVFYFGLLDPEEEHQIAVVAFGEDGLLSSSKASFKVVAFEGDTWKKEVYTDYATCTATDEGFKLNDFWLNDLLYSYAELKWFDSVQGFRIVGIDYSEPLILPPVVVVSEPPVVPPVEPPTPDCVDCDQPEDDDCVAHQEGDGNCEVGGGLGGGNGTDNEGSN